MIRAYCESDLESVSEMVAKGRPSISRELVATRMARHGIVYELNGKIQGIAAQWYLLKKATNHYHLSCPSA